MKKYLFIALSLLTFSTTTHAGGDDEVFDHGKTTHDEHCNKCHTDAMYTRKDRFVKSIDALSSQVVRCQVGNDIAWFDEDTDAVVHFLNQKYYKF